MGNNIIPIDVTYRSPVIIDDSNELNKGTSFQMLGAWSEGLHCYNDDYIITFVSYNNKL